MGLAKEEFRFLIAFLLAGFVADTVQKWGRRRTNYASLCGCTRNLLIQIASLVPLGNADDADGMPGGIATRRTLGRHVILAFELAVLKSRGHLDSEEGKIFLIAEGLVTEAEWEALIPGDRHTAVFFWIQLALRRLTDDGKLSHDAFSQCCACAITDMRAQANDLMSSLDRDTPFPYMALAGFLVEINLLLMSTWKGLEWSQWVAMHEGNIVTLPKFWADVLVLFLWNLSYQGMYDLSYIMHNPFLDRRIDVAHEAIGAGLRQLSIDLMVPKLPPTIVPPAKRNARVRRRKDDMQDGEDTTSVGRTPVKERLAGMSGGVEGGERREKRAGQQRVKRDLRV